MSRAIDAKVADRVFGLKVEQNVGDKKPRFTLVDGMAPARYSEDPAADYEVLLYVRGKWDEPETRYFNSALQNLWMQREAQQRKYTVYGFWFGFWYEPGDYSKAALKALGEDA